MKYPYDATQAEPPDGRHRQVEIKRLLKSDPTASLTLRTVTLTDLEDTLSIAVGMDDPVLLDVVNPLGPNDTNPG